VQFKAPKNNAPTVTSLAGLHEAEKRCRRCPLVQGRDSGRARPGPPQSRYDVDRRAAGRQGGLHESSFLAFGEAVV
jgi:hypothetical protein